MRSRERALCQAMSQNAQTPQSLTADSVWGVAQDYLLSLTGSRALRELPSPGKSGSVFYLSDDERFLVKTVSREEARLLLARIPAYFRHCAAHPRTLLTRFYGVHRVKSLGSRLAPKVGQRACQGLCTFCGVWAFGSASV